MKNITKLFLVTTAIFSFGFINPTPFEPNKINIVIDAGHGGHDTGATLDGIMEKQIVEEITNKIKLLNKNENIIIHLTRTDDEFVDLIDRAKFINSVKPDVFISLHVNSNKDEMKSGTEFYVNELSPVCENSKELATKLNNKFIKNNNLKSGKIKHAPYMILKKTTVPGMIFELGYLTNENDKKYLTDSNEQNKIAETILEFASELKK